MRLLLLFLLALPTAHAEEPADAPEEPADAPEDTDADELPDPSEIPDPGALTPIPPPAFVRALAPVPRVVLAASVGAAVPLSGLGPSVAAGSEIGVVLDRMGRFTALLGLGYSGGTASGEGTDPAFPDGYTWSVSLRSLHVAPALRVRLLPWAEAVSPEVMVGPLVASVEVLGNGSANGAPFPETRELRPGVGGMAAAGIVARAGPGVVEGRVTFALVHHDGDITGPALVPSLTPAIGYRLSR